MSADLASLADHVVTEDAGAARGRPGQPREDAQRRGLAGAVRAEEAEHRALRHAQVDAIQGARLAVQLGEPGDLHGRRGDAGRAQESASTAGGEGGGESWTSDAPAPGAGP